MLLINKYITTAAIINITFTCNPEPSHSSILQDLLASPTHIEPPPLGTGFEHVRVCFPPPHDFEHRLQALQPPLTGHTYVLHNILV